MPLYKPQKIYLEQAARDFPLTARILKRLPDVPVEEVTDIKTLLYTLRQKRDPIGEGKRALLLAYDKGRSFKPFPEAEQYLSCDYFTLHVAEGCDLECSYCILQAYLTNPLLTVFVNIEEMLANLQKDIGVILFINTSLSEQDMRHYVSLYKAVWAHADALKLAQATGAGR